MTCRTIALPLVLLTTVVALIALSLAAPACALSAPVGQNGAGDLVAETEVTVAVTATLAPTPTLQAELSPLVNAVMVKQATIEALDASGAAPGQDDISRPQTINVSVYAVDEQRSDVETFLADNGVPVRGKMKCGDECLILWADVPVSLLQALSVHPAVGLIDSTKRYYEQLDEYLHNIVAEYDAGLITEQEALARILGPRRNDRVLLTVTVDNETNAATVINFLENNDVYVPTENLLTTTFFAALIPVSLILPLSQRTGVLHIGVYAMGYDNDNPDPVLEEYIDSQFFAPSSRQVSGETIASEVGHQHQRQFPAPTAVSLAIATHGADRWH